jgi:hypothetical protein
MFPTAARSTKLLRHCGHANKSVAGEGKTL